MRLVNEIISKVFTLSSDLFEGAWHGEGGKQKSKESNKDKDNLQQVAFDVLCHKLLGKSLSRT